ncbi:MAG: 2-amino-4-hydroxy-6-hydroxymethyldihydropteridine diphosphokinase [Cytophagaceae bacterium]|nr:2-amino-4-hydroxy-6-hydroxymethyldihydropteridine diphosphokinase [Cytophagaceae bacterium]
MNPLKNIYLSLGSNQGDPFENLQVATNHIFNKIGSIEKISPIYSTPPWGFEGNDFLNCAIHAKTRLNPLTLLQSCLFIEKEMGRVRQRKNGNTSYEDRVIDIDIIFYEDDVLEEEALHIPHPLMQERNFVLRPLNDIAARVKHPIFNKEVQQLLQESGDTASADKINRWLKNPQAAYDFGKLDFLTIEGNIGAGKTTLSTMIAEDFDGKLILERFKDNPFLPKFYKDQSRYAFALEMSFLADRYQQLLDDLGQYDLFKDFMISDYDSHKSLIFAKVTLNEDEYNLYKKLHGMMYKEIQKPDLYIYLHQDTERLLANIKKRGREYEKDINADYLEKINAGYMSYMRSKAGDKVKIIDVSRLNFVESREDYLSILNSILQEG